MGRLAKTAIASAIGLGVIVATPPAMLVAAKVWQDQSPETLRRVVLTVTVAFDDGFDAALAEVAAHSAGEAKQPAPQLALVSSAQASNRTAGE